MIGSKKTAIFILALATTWSVNALAQPANSISKPPLMAYTACEGKQSGEKSSFVSQMGNTISGLCEQQQDGRLILKPDQLIRSNSIPSEAYQECIGKGLGDVAQITAPNGDEIHGTCQSDGDRLYLRPDSPPGMDAGIHAGMKIHNGGQYQTPVQDHQDGSMPQQDIPQEQSTAPEELHSNVQEQQQQQQADPPSPADKPEEQQTQPQPQQPEKKPQEKPKGFLGKMKDFLKNLW